MTLTEDTKAALRREIGPPTDRDAKWQPMIAASEVRALLDALDNITARLTRVEALADEWESAGEPSRVTYLRAAYDLRAALAAAPSREGES